MLPLNYGAARGQEMGQALIWAAKDCKTLHWNWSRCREIPSTLMITNSPDICFNVASPSAVSLVVAADTGWIFTAEMDVWGLPISE